MKKPTIGIITALPKEYAAMKVGLSEGIEYPIKAGRGLKCKCWIGTVRNAKKEKITVALLLSGMGNNVASSRASQLLSAFGSINAIIMTGIAGGVPNADKPEEHVRLGDIVVSNKRGVIQYDFDKEENTWTEIRACPVAPSSSLLHAIQLLEAEEMEGKRPWNEEITRILKILKWKRPPVQSDILHSTESGQVVRKHPRDLKRIPRIPRIFMGPVGSANKLLKNATKRDMLRDDFGVRAIEMEGSGIADASWIHDCGYLVIRGICDYCDSAKNNLWQEYAAAGAAGYTLALLKSLPGEQDKGLDFLPRLDTSIKITDSDVSKQDYVSQLYEMLGNRVEKHYIDDRFKLYSVVNTSVPGIGETRTLVSVPPVTSREQGAATSWNRYIQSAVTWHGCEKSVFVLEGSCNTTYRELPPNCRILSLTDLEQQMLDVRSALQHFCQEYEKLDIYHCYMPLAATGKGLNSTVSEELTSDIAESLTTWIDSNKYLYISVLGDYGAGKTTLLTRLKYIYAKRHSSRECKRKPLLINLRDYHKYKNLDSLLHISLIANYAREVPKSVFWNSAEQGDFVFLLDGFDEMAARVNKVVRRQLFLELSPLLRTSSPALLTCRPAYFVSAQEHNELVASLFSVTTPPLGSSEKSLFVAEAVNTLENQLAQKYVFDKPVENLSSKSTIAVTLKTLSNAQIDAFLRKHDSSFQRVAGVSWLMVKDFLESVYDLHDLMQRPIILSMIVTTVLARHIDIAAKSLKFGASSLYRIYTSMELSRDWHKGATRQLLSKDERTDFAVALALAMHKNKTLEVTHKQLLNIIKRNGEIQKRMRRFHSIDVNSLATDVRTCAFLTTSGEKHFRFAHRSFMEYFVAYHVYCLLKQKKLPHLLRERLPFEILYFLGGFAISDPQIGKLLRRVLKKSASDSQTYAHCQRNAAIAILYSAPIVSGIKFQHIMLDDFALSRFTCRNLLFSGIHFKDCSFNNAVFVETAFEQVVLEKCKLVECVIERSTVDMKLHEPEVSRLKCRLCKAITIYSLSPSIIEDSIFEKCRVLMKGGVRLWRGEAFSSSFNMHAFKEAEPAFSNYTFRKCKLRCRNLEYHVDLRECKLTDCELWGIRLTHGSQSSLTLDESTCGYVYVENLVDLRSAQPCLHCVCKRVVFLTHRMLEIKSPPLDEMRDAISRHAGERFASHFLQSYQRDESTRNLN